MSEAQRVAIVTGAGGGIGGAMTRGLLAEGSESPGSIATVIRWKRSRRARASRETPPNCSPSRPI